MTEFSYLIITLKNFLKFEHLFFAFKNILVLSTVHWSIQLVFFINNFFPPEKKKKTLNGWCSYAVTTWQTKQHKIPLKNKIKIQ
jgi:hypothetical protein